MVEIREVYREAAGSVLADASSTSDSGMVGTLVGAALAYLPTLWLTAGVAVLLVGLAPRAAQLAWIVPLYGFLVGYLGQILQFPDWLNNLSPFGHIPQLPAKELTVTPLLMLTGIAAALVFAGLAAFRRREIILT